MRRSRPIDQQKQLEHLEQKHGRLKARVSELDGKLFLDTGEQGELVRLKKEKLATKDALEGLRREQSA